MNQAREHQAPAWCGELETAMEKMARDLAVSVRRWSGPEIIFTPEAFGYIPGEKATEAIQRAIDAAALHGGIVRLRRGNMSAARL